MDESSQNLETANLEGISKYNWLGRPLLRK